MNKVRQVEVGDSLIPTKNIRYKSAWLGTQTVLTKGKEYVVDSILNWDTPCVVDNQGLGRVVSEEGYYKIIPNKVDVKKMLKEMK